MTSRTRRLELSPSRPLRIVVVGSSVGYFVRPPGAGRLDGPYPEQLTTVLADAGIPVSVTNRSRWFQQIDVAFEQIEHDVFAAVPDVVIINFGWVECQPKLFPTRMVEWLSTYRPTLNPRSAWVRRRVVSLGARVYKRLTPMVGRRVRLPSRMGERQFRSELERYIRTVRREQRALVVALNVNPPSSRIEETLPGVGARAEQFSASIEELVSELEDPQVRVANTRDIVLADGADAILPDGIHFSVSGHRRVAEELAELIQAWLEEC